LNDQQDQESQLFSFSPFSKTFYFFIAIFVLGIPLYLVHFPANLGNRWGLYLGILAGEMIYLILGFFVGTSPKTTTKDWLVNPSQISDNFNRFLAFINIILLPGRLISEAVMNFLELINFY